MDPLISDVKASPVEPDRPPIRIVLADDSYLARLALKHLFERVESIVVVGECDDARAVVPLLDRCRADLLITDIRMPPSGEDEGSVWRPA